MAKLSETYNLAVKNDNLLAEWDYELNEKNPEEYTPGSNQSVYWKCSTCDHSWKAMIKDRTNKKNPSGCPACSGRVASSTNNLAVEHENLLAEWDYELNEKSPEEYTPGSEQSVYWKCSTCTHSWKAVIKNRTKKNPTGCPALSMHVAISTNNLAVEHENLLAEWDYELNEKLPEEYTPGSKQSVYWKCSTCDHSWTARINNRTKKNPTGCPACSGHVAISTNNLAVEHENLLAEWDYELNEKSPEEYTPGSNQSVYWKCLTCSHSWKAVINSRTKRSSGCPACAKKFNQTEDAFREFVENLTGLEFPSERIPLARKRSNHAQVDMINHALKLIIEYDGSYWHKDRIANDIHTTESMIQAGYRVIRIREQSRDYSLPFLKIDDKLSSNLYQISYTCFGKNADTIENICQKIITDKMEWFTQDSALLEAPQVIFAEKSTMR